MSRLRNLQALLHSAFARPRRSLPLVIIVGALASVACSSGVVQSPPSSNIAPVSIPDGSTPILGGRNSIDLQEELSRFYQPLLGLDDIRPIYDPAVTTPENAGLDSDELVIGLSTSGQARAYPVRTLRFREMVNDELAGMPVLVTW